MLGRQELVNKIVSKNTGISEEEVTKVMDFCYKELTNELQNCDHPFIYVRGLGTFVVKKRAVQKRLYRLIFMIRRRKVMRPSTVRDKALKTMINETFRLFNVRRMVKNIYKLQDSINSQG
jgi:nucleoid DNA-binding protein